MRRKVPDRKKFEGQWKLAAVGVSAAGLSSLLLSMAHSTWASGWWALIALVPIMIASSRTRSQVQVALLGVLASIGPSSLMFESITASHPWAATVAAISQAPQMILPLLVWSRLTAIKPGVLPPLAFATVWIVWEQVRLHPLLAGEFASFYALAYSQVDTGLLAHTPGGIVVVSFLIAASNAVIATNVDEERMVRGLPLLLLVVPSVVKHDSYEFVPASGHEKIQIIQTAWTPSERALMNGRHDHVVGHLQQTVLMTLTGDKNVRHSILPETTIHLRESAEELRTLIRDAGMTSNILAGVALMDDPSPGNSVVSIDNDGLETVYNKWQLVPIYETPVFNAGNHLAVLQLTNDFTVGILVCMDGTSTWLVGETKRAGADMVLVLSASDYGRGYSTPELHLHMMRAQAMLHRVSLVFLASNGPSAYVTPDGVIRQQLAQGVQGVMQVDLGHWQPDAGSDSWVLHGAAPLVAVASAIAGLLDRRFASYLPKRVAVR